MDVFKAENIFLDSYKKYKNRPTRILLAIYKGHYYKFFLAVIFYIIKHSPAWLMPIVIANITNAVMYPATDTMNTIMLNAGIIIFLVLLNVPMNYLHVHFKSSAIRSVEAGLRSALIRKLQQLSISFHKDAQSGKIQSKVMRDVEAVETLSSQVFINLLNIIINITIALVITLNRNKVIALFFLLTIPVASLTIVFFRERIKRQNHKFRREIEDTAARVMDMEEMIPVTRAHGLEQVEVKKMEKLVKNISEEGYRLDVIQANFGSVSWAIFQIFQVGCLVFTGGLALNGKMPGGDIILYQSYFTTIVTQVSALIMLLPTIARGMESVVSIGEVLNEYDIEENDDKLVIEGIEGSYELNNVMFQYNDALDYALKGLSLKVEPGETVAFVGGSGEGKSTALNLLIGFILPSKGHLYIDGYDVKDINLRSYRKHISVVPQNTILFSGTIRENITYGMSFVSEEQLNEAIEAANLTELIKELPEGLETMIGEHGNKLSGGQRQRIAITRAIIRNPKVIIFDEATSALDSVSETLILNALDNLTKGRTTFIVAHRLSTIRKADKICVIKQGRCVEFGTYEELIANKGAFYEMKILQS